MSSYTKGFEAKQKPISPSNCGLAIAIPLEREAFVQRLERTDEGNFVQTFCAQRRNLSVSGLWNLYEPYARFTRDVAARMRGLGVSVVVDASLDQFASLLSDCDVVALVAQWRSALFRPADIPDPAGVFSQLSEPTSPLGRAVRRFATYPTPADPIGAESIAVVLNQALLSGVQIPDVQNGRSPKLGAITRYQYELYQRRDLLAATAAFKGGAGVEFMEGFRRIDEIVVRFPLQFSGLVDLTVCNSVLLAENIRRARPYCLVLANEDLAYLDFRLATFEQVIRILSEKPEPYEDVVYRIRKELQEVGLNEAKGRVGTLFGIWSALWRKSRRRRARSRYQ